MKIYAVLAGLLLVAACDKQSLNSLPPDMVLIPAGEFMMGSQRMDNDGLQQRYGFERDLFINEHPEHRRFLPAFLLDKYEVSNAQYKGFVLATQRPEPQYWIQNGYNVRPENLRMASSDRLRWIATEYFKLDRDTRLMDKQTLLQLLFDSQRQRDHLPVSGVSWFDAEAYCRWTSKRLPTEAEWEKAARGTAGVEYPWGDDWQSSLTNTGADSDSEQALVAVGQVAGDVSPYGVHDMAGNVSEWVADWYQPYPGSTVRDPDFGRLHRVVRGGGAGLGHYALSVFYRSARRAHALPAMVSSDVGFRCARDVSTTNAEHQG